jgi:hypothetical protein
MIFDSKSLTLDVSKKDELTFLPPDHHFLDSTIIHIVGAAFLTF